MHDHSTDGESMQSQENSVTDGKDVIAIFVTVTCTSNSDSCCFSETDIIVEDKTVLTGYLITYLCTCIYLVLLDS